MNNKIKILESMILLKENNIELLYESNKINNINLLDKNELVKINKELDNKYQYLIPIKDISKLSIEEQSLIIKKLKIKKIGNKLSNIILAEFIAGLIVYYFNKKFNKTIKNKEKAKKGMTTRYSNEKLTNKQEFTYTENRSYNNEIKHYENNELLSNKEKNRQISKLNKSISNTIKSLEKFYENYENLNCKLEEYDDIIDKNKLYKKLVTTFTPQIALIIGSNLTSIKYETIKIKDRDVFIKFNRGYIVKFLLLYKEPKSNKLVLKSYKI